MRKPTPQPRQTPPVAAPMPEPVLGPLTRQAAEISKRWAGPDRRLILLLAAYADASEPSPSARELTRRLGITVQELDAGLGHLAAGGLIWTERRPTRRNVYRLLFADDYPTGMQAREHAEWQAARQRRRDERARVAA